MSLELLENTLKDAYNVNNIKIEQENNTCNITFIFDLEYFKSKLEDIGFDNEDNNMMIKLITKVIEKISKAVIYNMSYNFYERPYHPIETLEMLKQVQLMEISKFLVERKFNGTLPEYLYHIIIVKAMSGKRWLDINI